MAALTALNPTKRSLTAHDGTRICWTEIGSGFPIVVSSAPAVPLSYWDGILRALGHRYQFLFVHTRGLWGNDLPEDLHAVTVDDHARDLAAVVTEANLNRYGMIGHCSGVTAIIASFAKLPAMPKRVVLASTRYSQGATMNVDKLLDRARNDVRYRHQVIRILTAYAPPALRDSLEHELAADVRNLEAQLRAVQSVRAYDYTDPWPTEVRAVLTAATGDIEPIRKTTVEYAEKLGDRCIARVELDGGHCVLQENVAVAQDFLASALGSATPLAKGGAA